MTLTIHATGARLSILCGVAALAAGCGSSSDSKTDQGTLESTNNKGGKTANGNTAGGNTGGKKGTPMSTFEKVEAWAQPGSSVGTFEDVQIPDMELFWVEWSDPNINTTKPAERRGVAVVKDATAWLEGKPAMREALDRGVDDAKQLALLSLHLFHGRGYLDVAAPAAAPARTQDTVTYYWRTDGSARNLMRSTLNLATLDVLSEPGVRTDAVEVAGQALASQGDIAAVGAISELSTNHCDDARTVPLLLNAATTHSQASVRAAAAEALGTCKASQAVDALVKLLETDPDDSVRMGAAAGLRGIGGSDVETALRAASAKESNDEVRRAISRAIKRIMAK
jgi:hypothetical protein